MWYLESGDLKGTSKKEELYDAFVDVLDTIEAETQTLPSLGVIAAASKVGFDFKADEDALYFMVIPILEKYGKLIDEVPEEDALSAEYINAPNSIVDRWDDVVLGTDGDVAL